MLFARWYRPILTVVRGLRGCPYCRFVISVAQRLLHKFSVPIVTIHASYASILIE
jgi:glutaredoxin